MSVKIQIAPYLQQYSGNKATIEVDAGKVGDCIDQLLKQFPEMEKMLFMEKDTLLPYVAIYVNLADSYPEQMAKAVKDGDEIYVCYVITGG
ncbi:MAG: MoaD/ThiS family protein [Chloroflexi bacterium]|nr:MoaD/ThiS family protein [Chloroflexota bacterium]